MTRSLGTVGIDCGKQGLDAAIFPSGETIRVENSLDGRRSLREWIVAHGVDRAGMEASGGYERAIRDLLCEAGLTVHVFNPARVRYFAKAKGRLAKNDRLDAAVIAEFTATMSGDWLPVTPDPAREELVGLVHARRRMVDKHADLRKAMRMAPEAAKTAFRHAVDALGAAITELETLIAEKRKANEAVDRTVTTLTSASGIGPVTALTLAVCIPELGHTSNAKIAALLGVAPFDQDSGQHHGLRRIIGGRADARHALYMATLVEATRTPGVIADFYARLVARGKPPKVALTACMRKLIVRLNGIPPAWAACSPDLSQGMLTA
ncbi:MAG: IS110 family transposase [Rhodospirillaceae bacterium]|nr:IS110 family transposase [Rhodospirillales bacterium]